jgi:hypothetical protein
MKNVSFNSLLLFFPELVKKCAGEERSANSEGRKKFSEGTLNH